MRNCGTWSPCSPGHEYLRDFGNGGFPSRMVTVEPYADALVTVNKWFDEGHIIFFFSSRTEALRDITETWLKKYGFKYHGVILGKPRGGNYHWIDNHVVRATRYIGKFGELVKKHKEIEVFEE